VPGSALRALFSNEHAVTEIDNRITIDRDPKVFLWMLQSMKNEFKKIKLGSKEDKELLDNEIEYWALEEPFLIKSLKDLFGR
jgi:hypothetical protein